MCGYGVNVGLVLLVTIILFIIVQDSKLLSYLLAEFSIYRLEIVEIGSFTFQSREKYRGCGKKLSSFFVFWFFGFLIFSLTFQPPMVTYF